MLVFMSYKKLKELYPTHMAFRFRPNFKVILVFTQLFFCHIGWSALLIFLNLIII